ncbi:Cacna1h, partial [Symbiodinium necroappetens]
EQVGQCPDASSSFHQYVALLTSEYEQIVHENEMLRHGHVLPIQKAAFDLNGSRRPTKSTSYPYSVASQQTSQASQPVADNSGSVSSFMNICWKVDAGTVPSTPVTTIIKAPEGSACYPQPARAQPREDCSGLQTPCSSRSLPSRPHSEAMQHQVFRNSSDIKAMICEQIRQDESRKEAAEYYHTTGFIRQIARTSLFDQITMCMIALYAIYLAIDTDYNPDDVNTDPSSVFFWMDQFFCTFFFVELLLRFLSIKSKYKCFKDVWFVFDFFLVATMVLQTWLVPLIQLFVHQVSASLAADASVLRIARLLRLTRLLRMARLLRYMPELFILVKAIVAAMRSVVFTLALLMLLLYAFSIAFTQSLKGTECGRIYFNNVLLSMQSFFIFGTLLDEVWDLVSAMVAEKLWLALAGLYFFIIFSSITIMNMLIGVMCEVITAVAAAEKESLQVSWVKDTLRRVMGGSDVFVDQEEFYQILRDQEVAVALNEIGVDIVSLIDFADLIFEERGIAKTTDAEGQAHQISFADFVEPVLQLQKSNTATVKDMVNLRWWLSQSLQRKLEERLTGSVGHAKLSVLSMLSTWPPGVLVSPHGRQNLQGSYLNSGILVLVLC